MTLLEECIQALGKNAETVDNDEIINKINAVIHLTDYGRIDWSKYNNTRNIDVEDIVSGKYFIIWDNAEMPVLKSELSAISENIYDVLAVSFDTWFVSEDFRNLIEFYHEGSIILGDIIDKIN